MEGWPRGRRRPPAKRVYRLKSDTAGSNPAPSAVFCLKFYDEKSSVECSQVPGTL